MYQRRFRGVIKCAMPEHIIGLTLLELMLAILIGSLILCLSCAFYLGVQKSIAMHDALTNMQDNARIVSQLLRTEIFRAGFVVHEDSIHSYHGSDMKPGTEGLTIKGAGTNTVSVVAMKNPTELILSDVSHFTVGDALVIFDANQYEIFNVKEVDAKDKKLIAEKPLKNFFEAYSEVSEYVANTYNIQKTDRKNADGTILYALYMIDIHGHKNEIAEGISDMKISYSVLDNDHLINFSASQIIDWSMVRGVTIAFLLNSLNSFSYKSQVFIYAAKRDS